MLDLEGIRLRLEVLGDGGRVYKANARDVLQIGYLKQTECFMLLLEGRRRPRWDRTCIPSSSEPLSAILCSRRRFRTYRIVR